MTSFPLNRAGLGGASWSRQKAITQRIDYYEDPTAPPANSIVPSVPEQRARDSTVTSQALTVDMSAQPSQTIHYSDATNQFVLGLLS